MLPESWLSLRSKYSSADRLLIASEMTPVRLKPARSREITRPLELHATPVQVHIWEAQLERYPWTLDLKESSALRSTTVGFIAERWLELTTATAMVTRARNLGIVEMENAKRNQ